MGSNDKEKYFIVLDLGTTSTRANVIDKNFSLVGGARFESTLIQGDDGSAELDPELYFNSIVQILREAVSSAGIEVSEIISLSLSCQRSTFITWDKVTGKSFHNLITWKDRRAIATVNRVNGSFLLKFINSGSKVLYALTRQELFMATSNLKMGNTWTNHRLQHAIENNDQLKKAIKENRAVYGLLDTWLLNKLKMNRSAEHISEITSSAATGMFDMFKLEFSTPMLAYFNIKRSILPKVVSNFSDFGYTDERIFGIPIRIDTVVSDQSASLIANCCFKQWSSKITLGTGACLQVNVGEKCKGSNAGANPLVAWSVKDKQNKPSTIFKLEFMHEPSSYAIRFMQVVGLCSDVRQLTTIAQCVEDSDGVFFIPEFYGFDGMKQSTTSSHLVRAVLENIIFTVSYFYFTMKKEAAYRPATIRIDGGIAQNDFVCQSIATLTAVNIERSKDCSELTSIGCAYLAAYKIGLLNSLDEAENFYKSDKVFVPDFGLSRGKLLEKYRQYLKVVRKL